MRVSRFVATLATATVVLAIASPVAASAPPTEPATTTGASVPAGFDWERIVPGGDCECADGGEFAFWVRRGDPREVVFFLEGGGACFDATTCGFTQNQGETYDWNVGPDDDPAQLRGIFDGTRTENPFADSTIIHVPYCTGDLHLGDTTTEYSPEVTVEHNGWVNGNAAVSYLAENFADADQVVVVGESAGSIAAPVYGGVIGDELPEAQITVFADGSGAYPSEPTVNEAIGGLWGVFETMPAWPENAGLTAADWGIPRFWVQLGLHDPDAVLGRFDYAYDGTQAAFMVITGLDTSDLLGSMDGNEADIEAAGVVQHSYTAPGSDHTLVRKDDFYTMEVNGVTLVEWVEALIAGEPMEDVHCDDCEPA
jgi:hypothetical protein